MDIGPSLAAIASGGISGLGEAAINGEVIRLDGALRMEPR